MKEPPRKAVGKGLVFLVVLAAVAVPAGHYFLSIWLPQHTDSDGDGWTDYDETHKYCTDPNTSNPNGFGTPNVLIVLFAARVWRSRVRCCGCI